MENANRLLESGPENSKRIVGGLRERAHIVPRRQWLRAWLWRRAVAWDRRQQARGEAQADPAARHAEAGEPGGAIGWWQRANEHERSCELINKLQSWPISSYSKSVTAGGVSR
jgi:hypothetical protein